MVSTLQPNSLNHGAHGRMVKFRNLTLRNVQIFVNYKIICSKNKEVMFFFKQKYRLETTKTWK